MKNLIILLSVFACSVVFAQAQTERFDAAMTGIVNQINAVDGPVDWQEISNKLERIAQAEPEQWLPQYYLGYASLELALAAMQAGNSTKVAELVHRSENFLAQARTLTADNSELKCLEGYVYQGYLWIDPMTNGPKYSPLAHQAYGMAAAMDATNPRPAALQGMLILYTPEFFGGGAEKALPLLQKAQGQFVAEGTIDKGILPQWGATSNNWMLEKATKDIEAKE